MAAWVSPFSPARLPELPTIDGVRLAAAEAGIRYLNRKDLLLVRFDPAAAVAGVFTRSRCASAPVEWCRERLKVGRARALVVNSGNANAFTGMAGIEAAARTAEAAAKAVGCGPDEVFLASTGVIGEPLDPAPFEQHLGRLAGEASAGAFEEGARAIMTTDTYPKLATRSLDLSGRRVQLNGIAKGSGMIAPDMATMLGFLFTDAFVPERVLQELLQAAVERSFNAISVDGDTSTSDTVLLFATGAAAAGGDAVATGEPAYGAFSAALEELCLDLAHQIVRDGEGCTKFVKVEVSGAESDASAKRVAASIANSPLVKTAMAGGDANWGRIVMAVGKAGEPADRDRLSIWFGPHQVAANGERSPSYSEDAVSAYMRQRELALRVDLAIGAGQAVMWTCDLTQDYIAINADYRS